MDIVGTKIVYITDRYLGTYDFETRAKVSTGLNFSGTDIYDMVRWGNEMKTFVYACQEASRMKLYSYTFSEKVKK